MFRLLTSWRALAVALVLFLGGLVLLAGNLEDQQRTRTLQQVVREAQLVDQLLVGVELPPDGTAPSSLSPGAVARVDRGVSRLITEGRLVGLTVWSPDGRLLYSDADESDHLEEEELDAVPAVLAGRPRVTFEQDSWRPEATATVLVRSGTGVVSEVFLPQDDVADRLAAASRRLYIGTGVLLLLLTCLALSGRRRLVRREHQALHDPLTGLGNRTLLRREGERLLDRSRRDRDRRSRPGPVTALLLVDLDGFKSVNDTLGHAVGDQLLVGVAAALARGHRRGDVVARLGGDEFALLLPGLRDVTDALGAARSVEERLRRPVLADGHEVSVGASIGVALSPDHGQDLVVLLQRADEAMYRAKRSGGGVRLVAPDGAELPAPRAGVPVG